MLSHFFFCILALTQQSDPIELSVDLREAVRGVVHTREVIPAKPGNMALYLPKYIPGEHGMTDRINLMVNLHFFAGGKEIPWRRDAVDVFAFRVTVPQGANSLTVSFDEVRDDGENSANMCRVHWDRVLLYVAGIPAKKQLFRASVQLPAGWNVSTALDRDRVEGSTVHFRSTPLDRLVDSPCLMGRFHRQYDVSASDGVKSTIELYGEAPAKIAFSDEDVRGAKRLMAELLACTGAGHYNRYQFLLSFSEAAGAGLEHSESSEDGIGEDALLEEGHVGIWEVLAHEGFHSWCGKYRRPAGMCTSDFHVPFKDELLWVYEGMTEFYGEVVQVRAGVMSPEFFRNLFARVAQGLIVAQGRNWRSIADTAHIPMMPSSSGPVPWQYARRGWDYYWEMDLVWLECDMRIRTLTNNAKSLSDFCRIFFGGPNRGPEVKAYDFDEVVKTLNRVAPYDWARFLRDRVYAIRPMPPLNAFELSGWRYVETDEPATGQKDSPNLLASIGMNFSGDKIQEIVPGYPADKAGLAPGWRVLEINGKPFSFDAVKQAIKAKGVLSFLVEHDKMKETFVLDYHGGLKYASLARISGQPDLMAELFKPLAK